MSFLNNEIISIRYEIDKDKEKENSDENRDAI